MYNGSEGTRSAKMADQTNSAEVNNLMSDIILWKVEPLAVFGLEFNSSQYWMVSRPEQWYNVNLRRLKTS